VKPLVFLDNNTAKNMNRNQKLDAILKYMSENIGKIPARPTYITEKAGLNIEKGEAYSMLYMLRSDGYVFSKDGEAYYSMLYKGVIFLDNGGYSIQHRVFKRKMLAKKISDYVDMLLKPIGLLTTIYVIIKATIKFLE
jgi:hypothetical protein